MLYINTVFIYLASLQQTCGVSPTIGQARLPEWGQSSAYITTRLSATGLRSVTDAAVVYCSIIVNTDRFLLLTVVVASQATDAGTRGTCTAYYSRTRR